MLLGFLVEFVSTPVVTGFTAAAAVTIASSQIKNLLGISFESHSFIQTWSNIFEHAGETRLWDAVLGCSCCVVLFALKVIITVRLTKFPCSRELLSTDNLKGFAPTELAERLIRIRLSFTMWFSPDVFLLSCALN